FLKCQKAGLRDGLIVDAATLEATCLGTGDQTQPDADGRIGKFCVIRVANTIAQQCAATDLTDAFPACQSANAIGLASCLGAESACRLCQLLNGADGLARDCDRFDDGNGANGSCGAECADGVVQAEEGCDDGNAAAGDGCSASCHVEVGWTCTGTPSVCTPDCGDGNLDAAETCDDG